MLLVFDAPCQLPLLAGPEHGRTIPFGVIGGIEIPQRSAFIDARVPSAVLSTHHLGDTAAEAQQCDKWAVGSWRRLPVVPDGAPVPKEKRFDQCYEPQQWANLLGK